MATKYLFAAMKARTDNPVQKLILIYLADRANENGVCWPAHSTIAADCECSVATVKRHIDGLICKGYINAENKSNKGFKTSNRYTIIEPELIESNGKIAQSELTDSSQRAIEPISNLPLNPLSKGEGKFVKPTLPELTEHCVSKGYTFDPETFINHYESNGWKVGRASMKCWKSACVTWQKREKLNRGSNGQNQRQARHQDQGRLSAVGRVKQARERARLRQSGTDVGSVGPHD